MVEKEYSEQFRNVLRRMKSTTNIKRYNAVNNLVHNEKEERLWQLCMKFWPKEYREENDDIEHFVPNDMLDLGTARRYICEIQQLLDELGWEKE